MTGLILFARLLARHLANALEDVLDPNPTRDLPRWCQCGREFTIRPAVRVCLFCDGAKGATREPVYVPLRWSMA